MKSVRGKQRQRIFVGLLALALVGVGGGVVATQFVRSPAQVVADTAAPASVRLTEPVRKEKLSSRMILRAQVQAAAPSSLVAPLQLSEHPVVSKVVVAQGQRLTPGKAIMHVAGRPILALHGTFPAYRDLKRADRGEDVAQLQAALRRIGLLSAGKRVDYDEATEQAVKRLYVRAGWPERPDLPQSEVIYTEAFDVPIDTVSVRVGGQLKAGEPLLVFDDTPATLTTTLDPGQEGLLSAKSPVTITNEALGEDITGETADIVTTPTPAKPAGDSPMAGGPPGGGESKNDQTQRKALTYRTDKPIPKSWVGADVRVVITTASTPDEVLAVPAIALRSDHSGASYVTAVDSAGQERKVEVTAKTVSAGLVEVTPKGGELTTRDQVVVN